MVETIKEISVIIPVYNRAYCLSRCICGILNQSFVDFECIIVDDGSTDGTWDVCQEYARQDNRVRCYRHVENLGVSAARNKGLEESRAKFICFVDSDDYVDNDYLLELYNVIDGHGLSLCGYKYYKNDVLIFLRCLPVGQTVALNMEHEKIFCSVLELGLLSGPVCKLYRKDIIESHNLKFPLDISNGEDTIFNINYLRYIDSFRTVPKTLYHITYTKGSLSDNAFEKCTYELFLAFWSGWVELCKVKTMYGTSLDSYMNQLYCGHVWWGIMHFLYRKDLSSLYQRVIYVKQMYLKVDKDRIRQTTPSLRRTLSIHPIKTFLLFYFIKKIGLYSFVRFIFYRIKYNRILNF